MAVDANFTKQRRPVFRYGSPKWVAVRQWGWYVELFFRISSGDQASLPMSPGEWLRCWDEWPRLMAVMEVVQDRVRHHLAEEHDRTVAEAKSHARARHV